MEGIFKKLNYKNQRVLCVLQAPESFRTALDELPPEVEIRYSMQSSGALDFVIAFVTTQSAIYELAPVIAQSLNGDGIVWFAYPKQSSKRYTCEFNRDTGWGLLGKLGFEPVRQVSIDEDWTALRFRQAAYIKKMSRNFAISEEGKRKTAAQDAEEAAE